MILPYLSIASLSIVFSFASVPSMPFQNISKYEKKNAVLFFQLSLFIPEEFKL